MSNLKLSIDEQVAYLMQGTEYGDEALKQAMANELRQRLVEAEMQGRPLLRSLAKSWSRSSHSSFPTVAVI